MQVSIEMTFAPESSEFDWVCPDCGSDEVEMTAWVHVNSNEICEGEGPGEQYWCPRCETILAAWCSERTAIMAARNRRIPDRFALGV